MIKLTKKFQKMPTLILLSLIKTLANIVCSNFTKFTTTTNFKTKFPTFVLNYAEKVYSTNYYQNFILK